MDWVLYLSLALSAGTLLGMAALLARRDPGEGALLDALERQERRLKAELAASREEASAQAVALRKEVGGVLKDLSTLQSNTLDGVGQQVGRLSQAMETRLEAFARQISEMTRANEQRHDALKAAIEQRLAALQEDNAVKLEQMRQTVDEKLQGTLEKRLGESFRLVSERLEQVHKGLGEMQNLASGVGDLKKVLTNVKTRGTWGEVQLGALLEQVLTPEQFAANGICKEGSAERVDFVIRLPGRSEVDGEVLLPIDAKFPQEDYERLVQASERADPDALETAARALELRVRSFARDIAAKYINPPRTTDFAILFLPTEGLYAEILRRPGLCDQLQTECRVTICSPTTLGALLNSLQMGFKTLAIQKRSGQVWKVLEEVKTEFARYGDVLDKVQKKLHEASNSIEDIAQRKRAIDRRLRLVSELPAPEPAPLLLGPEERPEF